MSYHWHGRLKDAAQGGERFPSGEGTQQAQGGVMNKKKGVGIKV